MGRAQSDLLILLFSSERNLHVEIENSILSFTDVAASSSLAILIQKGLACTCFIYILLFKSVKQ